MLVGADQIKAAFLSYPMLFQRRGGLQNQILQTVGALHQHNVAAKIIDPVRDDLADFDLVHVFSVINGTYRIVEAARAKGKPVVLSPLVQPDMSRWDALRFRLVSELTARLARYRACTTFDQEREALSTADHIIALSQAERRVLTQVFGQSPDRITIIPNGVQEGFFSAAPRLFLEKTGIGGPFVLVSGTVSAYKNQLGVVEATRAGGLPVVMAGPIDDDAYLAQCLKAGDGRVTYLGVLEYGDPLLESAYAAASVTVLISQGETFGLVAVESLAAGTPVVMTRKSGLELPERPPCLRYVEPASLCEVTAAISAAIQTPPDPEDCRALVRPLDWRRIAEEIRAVYERVL